MTAAINQPATAPPYEMGLEQELCECLATLAFLTTAVIDALDSDGQMSKREVSGAQSSLFALQNRLEAVMNAVARGAK